MSSKFEMIATFYLIGLWSARQVQNAVGRWLTQEEADDIIATKGEGA